MSDCPICKPDPLPPHHGPGIPVRLGGTRHRSTCPTIPMPSVEERRQLQADLAEIAKARIRAEVESRNIVIGGTRR